MRNPAILRSRKEAERAPHGAKRQSAWVRAGLLRPILLLAMFHGGAYGQAPSATEYQVKAAYLYNFAKFVEWPPASFPSESGAFHICVYGPDPFGKELQDITRNKMVNGRTFEISQLSDLQQVRGCHILFVSSSGKTPIKQILDSVRGSSVLTVGDSQGFAERGGMINFLLENDRVQFEVNRKAAEDAGLKISSKLLSVARMAKV